MFRRLPEPRLRLLPVLWMFWLLLAAVGWLVTGLLLANWGAPTTTLLMELRSLIQLHLLRILFFLSPWTILIGSLHYAILRLMSKSAIRTRSKREKWIGGIATFVIFSSFGIPLVRYIQYHNHLRTVHTGHVNEEVLSGLANQGKYKDLVDEMEIECARFDHAKAALGDRFTSRRAVANGLSYLFCNLPWEWEAVSRLAPERLLSFLQNVRYEGYNEEYGGDFGPWRPITEEMKKSQTPFIHVVGCFLLEDHAGFAQATYRMADGGNADYKPLAARAALSDPDPARSVKRMLMYEHILVGPGHWKAAYFNKTLMQKAITALEQGHSLAPLEARLQEIAEAHEMTPAQKALFRLDAKNPVISRFPRQLIKSFSTRHASQGDHSHPPSVA